MENAAGKGRRVQGWRAKVWFSGFYFSCYIGFILGNCIKKFAKKIFSVIVTLNLYSVLSHSASNTLDALNTAETDASLAGN